MLSISKIRTKLGRQIIVLNSLLLVIIIIYYFLGGFDKEELTSLLTLLTAISTIYIGALFKYISGNLVEIVPEKTNGAEEKSEVVKGKIILWIVPIHFVLLFGIISAKAFAQINFQDMNIMLGLLEAFFGGSMGLVINQVFPAGKQ